MSKKVDIADAIIKGGCVHVFVDALNPDAGFFFSTSAKEEYIGARRVERSFKIDGVEAERLSEIEALFPGTDSYELNFALEQAGFPQYPAPVTAGEREKIAERFTGASPSSDDPKNLRASLAWVLVHFAAAEYERQQYITENDIDAIWRTGIHMGRLVEWWVWRRGGYDRMAASRQISTAALNTSAANDYRKDDADEWHVEAREAANRIRKRNPYLKGKSAIARHVIKELQAANPAFDKSRDTVRKII